MRCGGVKPGRRKRGNAQKQKYGRRMQGSAVEEEEEEEIDEERVVL